MSSIGSSALDNAYNDALGSAVSDATGGKELDKQAFLMLLVTQFQYQDPLNPMEDKEFVAQLAQFSALEQQQTTNANLESLISIQQQQATISAANYIGKEVSARGYGVSLKDGKASTVQYAAAEEMSSCVVNILDSTTKTIVATIDLGRRAASIHDFTWNGKRSDGSVAADGVYTVSFVGYNTSGERVMVDTSVTGLVNGVSNYNDELYLRMDDGRTVTMTNVREVLLPKEAETPTGDAQDTDPEPDPEPESDGTGTTLTDDLDAVTQSAKDAISAWEAARDKIAALLAGGNSGG